METQDDLIAYYRAELDALRRSGSAFAARHPKVAAGLELGASGSADPHVERLIESFAYLTARLQKRMDDRFPEITSALLDVLYPNLMQPVPPLTIAQCTADPKRGKMTAGFKMPRGTRLFADTADGHACRFQTCYDTTVWPLRMAEAGFVPKASLDFLDNRSDVQTVLRLRLEPQGMAMGEMELRTLRFYLNGATQLTGTLYELLLGHCVQVGLYDAETKKVVLLDRDAVRAVGFHEGEEAIPAPPQAHPAYRLLQEYFLLPEKFLFLDVNGLDRNPSTSGLEILFLLSALPRDRVTISPTNFRLGCTPVVNLFSRTSEPIRVDYRRSEYRLIPDLRREQTTEIHSIATVIASVNPQESSATVQPYYDFSGNAQNTVFWYARRQQTSDATMDGTDMYLSFVDLQFDPRQPPSTTVYAHLLCTNRALAQELSEGSLLQLEEPAPLENIRCLMKPTATAYPPLGGSSRWALVSNLVLNHLSLDDSASSLDVLKKMLKFYSLMDLPDVTRQIEGIRRMETKPIVRRTGTGWQGWSQGTQVRLHVDESYYSGVSLFLFASVLRHFFALYGSVNTFTELMLETTQKSVTHRFDALRSEQPVL
ncbi:type VI secretion system baseplate subunit TssF [Terriglobus sp. RCC_193]|uniref:type VI secretion system baseplate subunit TssF n=1 Tax=Terriglobus sp. RCC_193 TaxID=3239218 RepID=UPI0035242618